MLLMLFQYDPIWPEYRSSTKQYLISNEGSNYLFKLLLLFLLLLLLLFKYVNYYHIVGPEHYTFTL